MSATHDEQALAAPYVLGALDASERRAFEAHLATCPICLAEVRSLQPVADALAHAVPQQTPRPELRRRVLGGIPGTAPGVTLLDAADAAPWPIPLVARTVNVYAVPLARPATTMGEAAPVPVSPPGLDVTV